MKRRMMKAVGALALSALAFASSSGSVAAANYSLRVEVQPRFVGVPLAYDALTNTTGAGQRVSVTRLDFLLSNIALRRADGAWLAQSNWFAYLSGREGRMSFELDRIPAGNYDRLRFNIGVPEKENHRNPATLPAHHPLNPNVNGLHWSWQGGYIFLALEGDWWRPDGKQGGYSWHIATDHLLMTVEFPAALDLSSDCEARLVLNVDQVFSGPHKIAITEDTTSTHSRAEDKLAAHLRANIERAFVMEEIRAARPRSFADSGGPNAGSAGKSAGNMTPLVASNATPYRFTFSSYFPQPALPLDNPLTEEGVALGRRLFNDPRLSINNSQSCASCHQAATGFADARKFSLGAEGQVGTRNAMPLFNLAWKNSFFWDGRAPTLRAQALEPIQNPIEMHETLTNVVAKLAALSLAPGFSPVSGDGVAETVSTVSSRPETAEAVGHAPGARVTGLKPGANERAGTRAGESIDYPGLFTAAFGSPDISADRIARALEQLLLTLVSYGSKFDRSLAGEVDLTDEEKRGFELFHTEYDPRREQFGADCFHCHGGPLFQSQGFANNGLDAAFTDPGRFDVTKKDGDRGRFAAPSLRNIAVTAPYMHDGRFATLEEVVEHYSTGVKRSATLDPNLAKHPDGGVRLSAQDQRALVAFLRTLTDKRFKPVAAPARRAMMREEVLPVLNNSAGVALHKLNKSADR